MYNVHKLNSYQNSQKQDIHVGDFCITDIQTESKGTEVTLSLPKLSNATGIIIDPFILSIISDDVRGVTKGFSSSMIVYRTLDLYNMSYSEYKDNLSQILYEFGFMHKYLYTKEQINLRLNMANLEETIINEVKSLIEKAVTNNTYRTLMSLVNIISSYLSISIYRQLIDVINNKKECISKEIINNISEAKLSNIASNKSNEIKEIILYKYLIYSNKYLYSDEDNMTKVSRTTLNCMIKVIDNVEYFRKPISENIDFDKMSKVGNVLYMDNQDVGHLVDYNTGLNNLCLDLVRYLEKELELEDLGDNPKCSDKDGVGDEMIHQYKTIYNEYLGKI
jgi:hypothetical protein